MTAKILLRIAAIVVATQFIGHSIGQNGWKKSKDPVLQEVAKQMMGSKFPNMGVFRSMGDYFDGYGYNTSVSMVFFIIILWIASCSVAPANDFVNNVILTLAFALLAISIIGFRYFFPAAAATTLLVSLLVFISWYMLRSAR